MNSTIKPKSWGGSRTGAGRKRGVPLPATLEKREIQIEKDTAKAIMKQRIMRSTAVLVDAQMNIARGVSFLYVIHTDKKGNRSKPEIVEDQETIEAYLAGELENDESEYFYIASKEPNNEAIKDLLNRAYDKPSEQTKVDVTLTFDPYKIARKADFIELAPISSKERLMERPSQVSEADTSTAEQK